MSDLIRRSDAIKAFEDVLDCDFPFISEETPRERIEAIPTADPNDEASRAYYEGWINGEKAERSRR